MARTETIEDFADFTKYVKNVETDGTLLFRGQPEDRELLPRVARILLRGPVESIEKQMLAEFKRLSLPLLDFVPDNEWDWLSLAQHHGMATRLLDWTTNPLAALYFAVGKPSRGARLGVVWIFEPPTRDIVSSEQITSGSKSPFDGRRTSVFRPNHITARIVSQGGWFTVHKYLGSENKEPFLPLERNRWYRKSLTRILIPVSSFAAMRYYLDRFGINEALLFPELQGLGTTIQWRHSLLEDETETTKARLSTASRPRRAARKKTKRR